MNNEIDDILKKYIEEFPNMSAKKLAENILGNNINIKRSRKTLMNNIYRLKAESVLNPDDEIIEENVKLARLAQRASDSNRIERKAFRDEARQIIDLEDLVKDYTALVKEHGFSNITKKHDFGSRKKQRLSTTGILQISDYHLNEIIATPEGNRYDFDIAAKRVKLYITEAVKHFKASGVNHVVFAILGDMINSNRRKSELVAMSTSRADAMFIAVELLSQAILEVAIDFRVTVMSVLGNEARIEEGHPEFDFTLGRENFDIMIHNTLELLLKEQKNVTFISGNIFEQVIEVEGQKILAIHGHSKSLHSEANVQKLIGKFATMGITLDHVLFGHIHATYNAPYFSRNGSLSGGNAYSSQNLQLASRAAQNIHFVTSKSINTMKIDLQEVNGIRGYDITRVLNKHSAKAVTDFYGKKNKIIKL